LMEDDVPAFVVMGLGLPLCQHTKNATLSWEGGSRAVRGRAGGA
jgi:hypothetical protein